MINLNANALYENLLGKIYGFQDAESQSDFRCLCKSLTVIAALIKESTELYGLFEENISLFSEMNSYFCVSNKRVYDASKIVLDIFGASEKRENDQEEKNDVIVEEKPPAVEIEDDLFGFAIEKKDEKDKEKKNFSFIKKKPNQQSTTNANTIDDIFSTTVPNNNTNTNPSDLLDLGSTPTPTSQNKQNILDEILTSSISTVDFTTLPQVDKKKIELDELFNKLNPNSIEQDQQSKPESNTSIDIFGGGAVFSSSTPTNKIKLRVDAKDFDFEKVYGKEDKPKDNFGFVNDMLKSKN